MEHKTHPDPAVSQLIEDPPFLAVFEAVPLLEVFGQALCFPTDGAEC